VVSFLQGFVQVAVELILSSPDLDCASGFDFLATNQIHKELSQL
jgi:hypothetical protein